MTGLDHRMAQAVLSGARRAQRAVATVSGKRHVAGRIGNGVTPAPCAPQRLTNLPHRMRGRLPDIDLRSEDVRLSPSEQRMVVVTTANVILLFDVDLRTRPVRVRFRTELRSPELSNPHGADWLDEHTLVVANRAGRLQVFAIPRGTRREPTTELQHVGAVETSWFGEPGETRELRGRTVVTGPGSVRVHGPTAIVCCNHRNTVTAHDVTRNDAGVTLSEGRLVAQEGLEIPDSAALSETTGWLAVSDHDHHRIVLYRFGDPRPVAALTHPELRTPHGLAFDPTGRTLVVADAGSTELFCFSEPDEGWGRAEVAPAHTLEGVQQQVFERVQADTPAPVRAVEGGTKGVDISADGRIAVTTCRGQVVRFFAIELAA